MGNEQYTLVLPSWFPSSVDLFNGDFNERMVIAYSKRIKSLVLYVVGDLNANKKRIEIQKKENYKVITLFYPKSERVFIGSIFNFFSYLLYSLGIANLIIKKYGRPKYIHCFVFFPAGLISLYFSKRYKLKQILTEHWTIFYDTMPKNVHRKNFFIKYLIKKLLSSFDLIMPVAHALKLKMLEFSPDSNYQIIPNVVDEGLFNFTKEFKSEKFVFVHASTLSYQKNPELLLYSFEKVLNQNCKAILKLIGPISKELVSLIKKSELLSKNVEILGELDHDKVAIEMKSANCLVLCSRFENLPCVILEALCCGLVIISSDVGGVSEVVNSSNGILVEEGNEIELTTAFVAVYKNYNLYHPKQISESAIERFNYQKNEKLLSDRLEVLNIL